MAGGAQGKPGWQHAGDDGDQQTDGDGRDGDRPVVADCRLDPEVAGHPAADALDAGDGGQQTQSRPADDEGGRLHDNHPQHLARSGPSLSTANSRRRSAVAITNVVAIDNPV
ncbi:MAG TPA: hypothetical protein VNT27_17895 [Propionibacteriaceae bacterium]|nr:hypothetical protein [Propionibacteriaceae bacterium]